MAAKGSITGRCTVCRHPDRVRIDYLAASGVELAPLGEKHGISKFAMLRHAKNHITDEFRRSVKIGPFKSEEHLRNLCADSGASVIENLRAVYSGLASRWLANLEAGADHALVAITAKVHDNLTLQARITRELMPAPPNVTFNQVNLNPNWFSSFADEMRDLARRHPAIRADLAEMLRRRITGDVASIGAIEGTSREVAHEHAA
jgi:hypothetical protein